ncbi:MAG: TolC family protein [Bacteroidales bacterium]|nr:TolC family protein [Bacteroidales bacterium]
MTLHDCMEYAISNSTKMRIQQAETGDAQIARRNAVLKAFTPSVSGNTYAYYNFGRSIDPETNTYVTETSFHNGYSVGAGIDLFNGFSAVNNLKISKTSLAIGQTKEKQVEADICLAVMEAYYNVVYYKRLVDIYEAQAVTAESSLARLRKQEEIGQKSHADVVQAEADLADRQYEVINTRNMYNDQLMNLADLMFWPVDQELVIDTENVIPSLDGDLNAADVVDFALANNPAVKIAGWQADNAKRELATARWQLLPRLSLNTGWSTSYFNYPGQDLHLDPYRDQLRNHQGEYIQFSMSIPIYDRLQGHDNVARKRNAFKRMTAQYDQKRRDVASEVRRAVQDCDGAATAYEQALKKSRVQEEAYQLNAKKMEQGLISSIEYQTATNNFLKAQADEMNSLLKYLIKQAVVRYYNGVEYINQ